MANPFCHIELNTDDVAKATAFYRRVFKWKLGKMPMGPGMVYTTIDVGEGTGGGMQQKPMPEAPPHWLPYVLVDSVAKTIAKAEKGGAQILVPFMPIPNMGAFGIFVDPTGAALGVWEPAKQPAKKAAKKPAKKATKKVAKKAAKKPAKRR